MRKKLVVANRKMYGSLPSNQAFLEGLLAGTSDYRNADYAVCVPHPYLQQAQAILKDTHIAWGGQNMSRYPEGPYTGSVSPGMLREFGCQYVIIGHSERRSRGHETDYASGERVNAAIRAGLTPIFCVGETLQEYDAGHTEAVTFRQLDAVLNQVGVEAFEHVVLAYEPIWAIGTGRPATPEHAQSTLKFLRNHVAFFDTRIANNMRILYGGSVKADNAASLFSQPDIDGGLVGSASLDIEEFVGICRAAN